MERAGDSAGSAGGLRLMTGSVEGWVGAAGASAGRGASCAREAVDMEAPAVSRIAASREGEGMGAPGESIKNVKQRDARRGKPG